LIPIIVTAGETAYQNEQAACRMLRELIEVHHTLPIATIEQIEQTQRGSASFDQYQVLSWADQKNVGTANAVVIEASYLTLTEAIMYDDYLLKQGKFVMINP
jgi:hypothetical protein